MNQQKSLIWLVTLATFGSGAINLLTLVHHFVPTQLERSVFPLGFIEASRWLTLVIGFALILSAFNIARRKRRAWQIVIGLTAASLIVHITRNGSLSTLLPSLVLFGLLIVTRKSFTVKSRNPNVIESIERFGVAVLVAVAYAAAGFWLLERREFGVEFNLLQSISAAVRYLFSFGDAGLQPQTLLARWFLRSLNVMSLTVLIYGVWSLFRPKRYTQQRDQDDVARVANLLQQYGRSAEDYFKLWPDKSYFFSSSGNGVVAYAVAHNMAVALGDPVAPEAELLQTLREFIAFAKDNGWAVAFHQVLPDFLQQYQSLGMHKFKTGDDAVVDLTTFTLKGGKAQNLRSTINKFERENYHIGFYEPPVSDQLIAQARQISDQWLASGRRERTFTLGQFTDDYARVTPMMTVEDGNNQLVAFVNLIPAYASKTATIDMMRHGENTPNGTMDYLFTNLFLHFQAAGYTRFSIGMAALDGFQVGENRSREENLVHEFAKNLDSIFSFASLKKYKAKFATIWEPRYLIFQHHADLPRLGLAISELTEIGEMQPLLTRAHLKQLREISGSISAEFKRQRAAKKAPASPQP
jgi:phosphatidylglycerol lysyltransferase